MTDERTRAKEITGALCAPFDVSLIEEKQSKRYIGHEHIRQRIIDATDNMFDWSVTDTDYRVDGNIKARNNGEVPPVMIVSGVLFIHGLGKRSGVGVQVIEANAGEDTYKAAESDAFKRAAMAFGVGLAQLYMNAPAIAPQPRQTNGTPPVAVPAAISTGHLTDEQFIAAYVDARNRKARAEITALMDRPDTESERWCGLVHASQTVKELDNLIGSMTDRQIPSNPKFERAVAERRKNLVGLEVPF